MGIDTNSFRRPGLLPCSRAGHRRRPVMFSARNFLPLYNQETVVEAFAQVRAEFPEAMLLMKDYNGDVEYKRRVMDQIAALPLEDAVRVVETVPHERMAELYSMANVTVSVPSSIRRRWRCSRLWHAAQFPSFPICHRCGSGLLTARTVILCQRTMWRVSRSGFCPYCAIGIQPRRSLRAIGSSPS